MVKRDDTTSALRHMVATQLNLNYKDIKPSSTLGELGCDELDFVELIMTIEEEFQIMIPETELEAIEAKKSWQQITIGELAEIARTKRNF